MSPPAEPRIELLFSGRGDHPSRSSEVLHRLRSGVRVREDEWRYLTPWERYLARVHAAAARHPDMVFSHESAAALWGLPLFGEPLHVHCFSASRYSSTRRGDVVIHTSIDSRDVTMHESGIRTTGPVHTTLDLVRVLPPAFGLALTDAAIAPRQLGITEVEALRTLLMSQRNTRGTARARWVLATADPRSEAPSESVSRAVIGWLGFEEPETQATFPWLGGTDRVDFFWRRARVIGETDGYAKYAAADSAAAAVEQITQEKRREDRLREQVRGFTRWEWRDAMSVVPLREKLVRAGVPIVSPPHTRALASLRSNPRSLR